MSTHVQRKITSALKTPPEQIVVTNPAANIRQPDLMRLKNPTGWLNDEVLNFYLHLVYEKNLRDNKLPNVYALKTFFYE